MTPPPHQAVATPLPGTTDTDRAVADTVAEPPPAERANLQSLTGIGSQWAALLQTAGVETVRDLARRNPANLHEKLIQVNEQEHVVDLVPSLEQITEWIAQAQGEGR